MTGLAGRLCRYGVSQRFGKHVDGSHDVPGVGTTGYTVLFYLSGGGRAVKGLKEGVKGGETVFWDDGRKLAAVKPAAGRALLHLHGDDCMEHEGAAVTAGVKYILRTDVVFR